MSDSQKKLALSLLGQAENEKQKRSNYDQHCRDVAEIILPNHKEEFLSTLKDQTQGEERHQEVYDATGTVALGRFASVLDSMITPRNSTWHKLVPTNPALQKERSVRLWFDELNRVFFKYRYAPKANFVSQNYQVFETMGAFGNGPLYIDSLEDEPGLRYKACSMGRFFFSTNHQGIIDTAFRYFKLTARQAAQKWPDNLPEKIRKYADKGGKDAEMEFEFLHAIKPREDVNPNRKDYRGMKYASYYVALEGETLLSENGYRSFPYAVSRYKVAPQEHYARSPAMEVLPSLRTLNEQKKTVLKQGHRAVDPVLFAYDDGVISEFSLRPGAVNMGGVDRNGRPLIHSLPVGNLAVGKDLMDDERQVINDVFLVTLFQILVETPVKTATEVLELVKEKGILIGPTFIQQETNYLGPMIEREAEVLTLNRLIPPIPPALLEADGEYTIMYDSPFSRSQRAEEAQGLLQVYDWAINVASQTGQVEVMDHFNTDEILPDIAHIFGLPEKWLNSMDDIQVIRGQRQQAQMQEEANRAAPGAAAMVKAAATAKEKAPDEFAQVVNQAG